MASGKVTYLPRLRPGIRFSPGGAPDQPSFIVEDTTRHLFYRIGLEEYLLLTHLQHAQSMEDLLARVAADTDVVLSEEQVQTVLGWLASRQLLQSDGSDMLSSMLHQDKQMQSMRRLNRMNLISFKIPLGNPDPVLNKIAPKLSWLTGPVSGFLWVVTALLALAVLFTHWQEFNAQTAGIFGASNLLLIWLIWLGLKIFHELFHALVCYRYGGRVYEAGILFILFIPLTYVDATTSWRFSSRWQRIHVALAGIIFELGIAWLALLVWYRTPETASGFIAHRTVLVAGISSLLFNGNPLMRFDGYYVLSDLVGIPNLYQLGVQSMKDSWAYIFLNIKAPQLSCSHPLFVQIYGVLVFIWRILVLASLGYMASKLMGGLGILVTLIALLLWISTPIATYIARWPLYRQKNQNVARDLFIRGTVIFCVVALLFTTLSWQESIRAPAVVVYKQQIRVKSGTSGFVRKILVHHGDRVEKGQTLMVLEDPVRDTALHDVELELEKNRIKSRVAYNSHRLPEMQMLRREKKALLSKFKQEQEQYAALTVRAPAGGEIIASGLDKLSATFLRKGDEILWIVNPGQKQLIASVSQDESIWLRGLVGQEVTVDMRESGLGLFQARVDRITPTASTRVINPGLAARYGGPIDVIQRTVSSREDSTRQHIELAFFSPRFSVELVLPPELLDNIWPGQLATILAKGHRITLSHQTANLFDRWLQKKNRAAEARSRQ